MGHEDDYVWVERDPIPDPLVMHDTAGPRRRRLWRQPTSDSPLPLIVYEALYRHVQGHNLADFRDADLLTPCPVDLDHGLQVIDARMHQILSPRDRRLPPIHDTVFVLCAAGASRRTYLVNSEDQVPAVLCVELRVPGPGFDFCKFVMPCDLVTYRADQVKLHREGPDSWRRFRAWFCGVLLPRLSSKEESKKNST